MPTLRDEILTDPEGLGYGPYVKSGEDNRITEMLNAPRYEVAEQITRSGLLAWAGAYGVLGALSDASEDKSSPIRSQAMAALRLLDLPDADAGRIDMSDQLVAQMFGALVAGGAISKEAAGALQATMPTGMVSRAERLWGVGVTDEQVGHALRGGQ